MNREIKHNSFVFYAQSLECIEAIGCPEEENAILRAVIEHAIYGEHAALEGKLEASVRLIINDIERAQARYEKNKEDGAIGGSRSRFNVVDVIALKNEGLSNEEIAEALGCSVRTVQRKIAAAPPQEATMGEKEFVF